MDQRAVEAGALSRALTNGIHPIRVGLNTIVGDAALRHDLDGITRLPDRSGRQFAKIDVEHEWHDGFTHIEIRSLVRATRVGLGERSNH